MRLLGLDYGEKRIGVALSDPLGLTAQPQTYIPNDDQTMAAVKALVTEYEVSTIVLGLPKNREGQDSAKATEVRAFGAALTECTGCDILYQDERFSTVAVNRTLLEADVSRKKRKEVIDSAAAAFILQGVLDARR